MYLWSYFEQSIDNHDIARINLIFIIIIFDFLL